MKLVGTRIRVEKSDIKTEYYPEYCVEYPKRWWRKEPKRVWYGVCEDSTEYFGEAYRIAYYMDDHHLFTLEWAKQIIDLALEKSVRVDYNRQHQQTKTVEYVKYP